MPTLNRVFGEQVLVAVGMSDKWPKRSKEVLVLLLDGEQALYQSAFKTFAGNMGVRPLRDGEEFWYKQIKPCFIYALAELFVNPPVATECANFPNPRPCRAVTSAGEETVHLSKEASMASSDHDLRLWDVVFTGVLRNLGIDHEEKKTKKAPTKKTVVKKKVTVDAGATSMKAGSGRATTGIPKKGTLRFRQSNLEDYVIASDSFEGSSGSAGSRAPDSGATPSSMHEEEEEAGEEVEGEKLVARKRSRGEAAATTPLAQKAAISKPIGKQGRLRSLYRFSPAERKTGEGDKPPGNVTEKEVEKVVEETAGTGPEMANGSEVVRITGLDQPLNKQKGPEVRTETSAAQHDAPIHTENVQTATGGLLATYRRR
ncbi:hypothetical protein Hanom_Chr06g00519981 [Helianthus anomalus]